MRKALYVMLAGLLILASCKEEEMGPVILDNPVAPTLTAPASGSAIVLTEAAAAENVAFSWTAADYGFQAAITYTLQFDKVGNNFATPTDVGSTTSLTLNKLVADLNNTMVAAEFPDGVVTNLEFRVKSYISDFVDDVFSPVVPLGVNPYMVTVVYPQLQVPGSYQGWDPGNNNTVIYSLKSDKKYEGYIWFPDPNAEFKFTDGPSWDTNWGDTGVDGTLDPGGDNIKAANAGYHRLNVNLNNLTYTSVHTAWGLVGSAQGSWDIDTDMTYDAANGVLTITIDLVAGDIKFRANDDWAINLGDNGANGSCEYDGANIVIASAGNYTITLDLKGPIYKNKIVKN